MIVLLNSQHTSRKTGLGLVPSHTKAESSVASADSTTPDQPFGLAQNHHLIINGCIHVLRVFLFLWRRRSLVLVCHLADLQALNAAMILILDASETGDNANLPLIRKSYRVFVEMKRLFGSRLSDLAVERLSAVLNPMRI